MLRRWRRRFAHSQIRAFFAVLGPGLIAASAGNDAGGVTTYSQAGAHYGYSLLWVLFFLTFSLAISQEMGARMAAVTGKGLADLIREEFGVRVALFAMAALVVANVATTVADFAGLAAVFEMFLPAKLTRLLFVPMVAGVIWLLVARGSYKRVERVFLAMCAVYLTYVVAAIVADPDWGTVIKQTVVPDFHTIKPDRGYLQMTIALIGTTVAPWMQFYIQSSVRDKGIDVSHYGLEKLDVLSGAVLSNLISFFMIVTCAATLFVRHVHIDSATDAAEALGFVGPAAKYLFAIGFFNAAMIGAVVVPLSTAYAVTESLGWESGLGRRIREAPLFIAVYTAVIVVAALPILAPNAHLIDIIVQAQVIDGILLPIVLVFALLLINKKRLMGEYTNSRLYNAIAWATVVIVACLSLIYLGMQVFG